MFRSRAAMSESVYAHLSPFESKTVSRFTSTWADVEALGCGRTLMHWFHVQVFNICQALFSQNSLGSSIFIYNTDHEEDDYHQS